MSSRRMTPREITEEVNPTPRQRLLIILAFPLILVLGLPWWWWSTSIVRLPLPEARIAALESNSLPALRTSILLTADRAAFPDPPPGKAQFDVEDVLTAVAEQVTKGVDGIHDKRRPKEERYWDIVVRDDPARPAPLKIHVRRWEHANASWPLRPYVQAPESGLMTSGISPGSVVVPVHPSHVGLRFQREHLKIALINSILALFPSAPAPLPLRALKYSPNITLSFVLLNEDSAEGSYVRAWDIEGATRDHFLPHLEPISDVFNFTIESQILYHAPLAFEPKFGRLQSVQDENMKIVIEAVNSQVDGKESGDAEQEAKELLREEQSGAWLIGDEEMKVFVNSERWSLDSGSSNNPVLRFLLFVPKQGHRPMHLAVQDSADAFLLPQFGSVVLLNPPSPDSASGNSETAFKLPLDSLAPSFHLFTQHLYALLDLPSVPDTLDPSPPPSPLLPPNELTGPISPWQLEQIYRARAAENSQEARKTLSGIVRLVKKIKEMKVEAGVRDTVEGAVKKLEELEHTTNAREAFLLSRDAVDLANKAFFDPSMMGLLYFPDEHKLAIYTPLFAPVAIPIVVGLLKELLAWRRKRRRATTTGSQEHAALMTPEQNGQPDGSQQEHRSSNGTDTPRRSGRLAGPDRSETVTIERGDSDTTVRRRGRRAS